MNLTELFCHVDDFWLAFAPWWQQQQLSSGTHQRQRAGQLCESEIMIHFHQARYRDFKSYYTRYVQVHLRQPALNPSVN